MPSGVIGCVRVDELLIVATGDRPIDDDSWDANCRFAATLVRRHGPHRGVLSWAPEYGPSTIQRRHLMQQYAEALAIAEQRRFALLTGSILMRGIVTAIGWLGEGKLKTRIFSADEVLETRAGRQSALDWLAEEVRFDRHTAAEALQELCAALAAGATRSVDG